MQAYNSKLESPETDALLDAILTLQTREECYRFFDDLCTITELKAMAQRLWVARLLEKKEVYQEITSLTGASTATISRVNRCLQYGANGYRLVLDRLKAMQSHSV